MKNIAIIFGGVSAEHDVSIITARQVYMSLDREKYVIYPLYLAQNGKMYYTFDIDIKAIKSGKKYPPVTIGVGDSSMYVRRAVGYKKIIIDDAILCTHGGNGEDGSVQGMLNMCGIKYTSSGVSGSAVTMDKILTKCVLNENKIPCVEYFVVREGDTLKDIRAKVDKLTYPVIVKPSSLGSSIGITKCDGEKTLKEAIALAREYDEHILVEKYIEGCREVNIAVLGDSSSELSMTEEPLSSSEILSYADKYLNNNKTKSKATKRRKMPAELTVKQKSMIERYAIDIFKIFNLRGVIRIDFIIDKEGLVYVNEINNIPGSMAYYLFKGSLKSLCDKLIAIADRSTNVRHVKYESKILDNYIGS